jgi:glycosyltransferase involved in cell wall biosynthesis
MANGTPVICFDHQGIGTIATEDTSIKIQPTSWDTSINDFSKAMIKLASNPVIVDILGENARKHVLENYTWNKKFDFIESIYSQLN